MLLAGADEMFLLDEASPAAARALHRAFTDDTLDAMLSGDPTLGTLVALLERAGAVHRGSVPSATLRWSVVSQGPTTPFLAHLRAFASASEGLVEVSEDPDFVMGVRAGGELVGLAEQMATVTAPHALLDLAYDHTLSLGPLVWPGETACLQCFAGRIRHAWGDPMPPKVPRATAYGAELAASLAVGLLRRFHREGALPELSGRSVSIDLSNFATRADAVHRLPWCPRCHPTQQPHSRGFYPFEEK